MSNNVLVSVKKMFSNFIVKEINHTSQHSNEFQNTICAFQKNCIETSSNYPTVFRSSVTFPMNYNNLLVLQKKHSFCRRHKNYTYSVQKNCDDHFAIIRLPIQSHSRQSIAVKQALAISVSLP